MPRTEAELPGGPRLSDVISVSLLAGAYPMDRVRRVLEETGTDSQRERVLPATLMVYYVMALALYMQISYVAILRVVTQTYAVIVDRPWTAPLPFKSSIAKARERLGPAPLRRLVEEMVRPIATPKTKGSFYRGWRVFSLDGSTMDIGDTQDNEREFGRPGVSRGPGSAFPQLRFCALLENGTHVLLGTKPGPYTTSEVALAKDVVASLEPGMLCLADRNFFGYALWTKAVRTGADLLWRVKTRLILPCEKRLPDGSYLSTIYASAKDRRHGQGGRRVRVIEFRVTGEGAPEDAVFQLLTTILDPEQAPATELAALYWQRWEVETTLDEFKTHLRGRGIVLRSKTPLGVYQEFWGFVLAHHAIRTVMHDAALKADVEPTRLSYKEALEMIKVHILEYADRPDTPPSAVA